MPLTDGNALITPGPFFEENLELICQFNLYSVNHFHSDWVKTAHKGDLIESLIEDPIAHTPISKFLFHRYRLNANWITDFSEPRTRVLLLPVELVNKLAFHIGLVLASAALRKIIDGNQLRLLSDAIGEAPFNFARKKAAFYNPGLIGKVIQIEEDCLTPDLIYDELLVKGMMCLGVIFFEEPKNYRNRLAIKLPKHYARFIVSGIYDNTPIEKLRVVRDAIYKILLKLIKELDPSWKTLFE